MAIKNKYPFYKQLDTMDCGPSCLQMVSAYYGKEIAIQDIRNKSHLSKQGASFDGISEAAEHFDIHTIPVLLPFKLLKQEIPLPVIAHWQQSHFVVIYEVNKTHVLLGDPAATGITKLTHQEFIKSWAQMDSTSVEGHLLLLEPTANFSNLKNNKQDKVNAISYIWSYLKDYKKQLNQLLIGLVFGSFLQLFFPFLTQAIVDYGINLKDLQFVYLILLAQIILFVSRSSVQIIRGWILLYLTNKVNIRLISDFLLKLIALPISFFYTKNTADILQRVSDNDKVQNFISSESLTTLFSFINALIFTIVLLYYSWVIAFVFLLGATLYVLWSLRFLKKRALYDHQEFALQSDSVKGVLQIINGIEEIKLNGSQRKKRWAWEALQIKLFNLSAKNLKLEQQQSYGATFINEFSNILITFIAANLVIKGSMTLGMMLAVQYILGQLNLPLANLIRFLKVGQDAKLSLIRLSEIKNEIGEENEIQDAIDIVPHQDIILKNVSFRYGPLTSTPVLEHINLTIPKNKITAIVGVSGSGKTTLFKLLLKFYQNYEGQITIGDKELKKLSPSAWRSKCGAVLQDGFIFNDTVLSNITESESGETIDFEKFNQAVKIANLTDLIATFPNKHNTIIGQEGVNLSGGERQRVLIARVVYKNPQYIFFDEATSALDSNNEKLIMQRLNHFYKNRTVLIIAHRLSTVKNADNIVVLDKSKLVEQGTHDQLITLKGHYHTLVKNQLELED